MQITDDGRLPGERVRITGLEDRLILEGDVGGAETAALARAAAGVECGTGITLDLEGVDVTDGEGAVALVNLVRSLLRLRGGVNVVGAPQLLAHNLYRVGLLLPDSGVHLQRTREDEPYG